jgi:hypothetical protein
MDDEVPILDEENYSTWRIEMRVHLKEMGAGIWKETIGGSVSLKNKSKFAAQREGKKNDALALKTILSGLSSPIKESMGQCTTAKDLWLKLEETYQSKKEDLEGISNEGKESHVMMLTKGKTLKTFQMKARNHVMMLTKGNTLKTFQMKVKNLHKPLIAIIQNVTMLNFSLQVKKKF